VHRFVNSKRETETDEKLIIESNIDLKNSSCSGDIGIISTNEASTDSSAKNVFKRKTVRKDSQEDLSKQIQNMKEEKDELSNITATEIHGIKQKCSETKREKLKEFEETHIGNRKIREEEHKILENSYKQEIVYLKLKIKNADDKLISKTQHDKILDDMTFNFEIRKKILNEKIKYFSTLLKEKNEVMQHNKTLMSNIDMSNFNFNDSSIFDKSVLVTNNDLTMSKVRQSETYDNIYSSIVMKENNVIGYINNIKPKFFTKEK